MKFKRIAAMALAGMMTLGLAACGSSGDGEKAKKKDDNKLTIWHGMNLLILRQQMKRKISMRKKILMQK